MRHTSARDYYFFFVRFAAFSLMLGAPLLYIFGLGGGADKAKQPKEYPADFFVNINGLSDLFGNAIFTFMTHHSLPGLLSPVRPESAITGVVGWSYSICCVLYIALCGSAMFAFWDTASSDPKQCKFGSEAACQIQVMYSTNFSTYHVKWVGGFVDTYPIMMVALYPLVCITFRNNVRKLYMVISRSSGGAQGIGSSVDSSSSSSSSSSASCVSEPGPMGPGIGTW